MDAVKPQATRPPLPYRPPKRVDRERSSEAHDQRRDAIPDVDIASAFRRRSMKSKIECGHHVKIGSNELVELKQLLGTRKCQMYSGSNAMSSCIICEDQCVDGEFAIETVLFIPNKNDAAYDHLGRFRVELPRIACHQCAKDYAADNGVQTANPAAPPTRFSLAAVWTKYQNNGLKPANAPKLRPVNSQRSNSAKSSHSGRGAVNSEDQKESTSMMGRGSMPSQHGHSGDSHRGQPQRHHGHSHGHHPGHGHSGRGNQGHHGHRGHHHGHAHHQHQSSSQKVAMPMEEAERDPFDDGFLICTQLVKTGGADQGGLQVGDVFVEFGHYSSKRFPGLKAIANLVRRSAGKEIHVVVWRKLEQMGPLDDDGTGRTVFQKLALKLKPLQSHDADGGGVLGAVINTYPLPEMKN